MAKSKVDLTSKQDISEVVNKNTKQRKRKRSIINLILILLFLLLAVAFGVITYFIVYNSVYTPPKEVVLTINQSAYEVGADGNELLVDDRNFKFEKGEESGTREPELVRELPANGSLRLDYKIDNINKIKYRYEIDFSDLLKDIDNCSIEWTLNNGEHRSLLNGDIVRLEDSESILISVYLKVIDPSYSAVCSGKLTITISVA